MTTKNPPPPTSGEQPYDLLERIDDEEDDLELDPVTMLPAGAPAGDEP